MFNRGDKRLVPGSRKSLIFVTRVIGWMLVGVSATLAQSGLLAPRYKQFFVKNVENNRSMPSSILSAHGISDQKIGRSYALIAGISHYPHLPEDKRSLPPAKVDLDGLVDFLKNKEYFDEIVLLEDEDVTLENLNYFLGVYFPDHMGSDKNNRFLFAYSGHGFDYGGDSYLLTSSAEQMDDRQHSIDLAQLKVAVEKSVPKALAALILINSCQGGSFLGRITFGDKHLVVAKHGAHAITAGAKGQFTYAPRDNGRGSYFFEEVLNGLRGGADVNNDGIITADQLYSFVRREVSQDTLGVQDPQFGDIEPHTSEGSFFFVRQAASSNMQLGQPSAGEKADCDGALILDNYAYAVSNNLQDDFLRSIDEDSWQKLKHVGGSSSALFSNGKSFVGGNFSLADDYATFDQKRAEHLKNVLYSRTHDQAASILRETIATRDYPNYTNCLRESRLSSPAFSVWATHETLEDIEIHIRYRGTSNNESTPIVWLEGGTVSGAPPGSLWTVPPVWNTSRREHHFLIRRNLSAPRTSVVLATPGSSVRSETYFERADALLSVTYVGTREEPRFESRRVSAITPNNNENRGNCPNEVGHHDGKYCTSRTKLTLTTSPPHFFRNAKIDCAGEGCPWGAVGPVTISADSLTASGYVDNWGSSFVATLTADEYTHISANQCGPETSIPVIKNKPVLIGIRKECLSLAMLKWTLLPEMSEGMLLFGDKGSTAAGLVLNGVPLQNDFAAFASYSLTK